MRKILVLALCAFQLSCGAVPRLFPEPVRPTAKPGAGIPPSLPDATPTPAETPTASGGALRAEEYTLYGDLLRGLYPTGGIRCIVLEDHTTAGYLAEWDEETYEHVRQNLPAASDELFEDFFLQNREPAALSPSFDAGVPVVLISPGETAEFLNSGTGDGWERFYDAYDGAQGIMEISRAGFNAGMDRALVYAGNQSGYLAGAGFLYLLEKAGAEWTVRDSLMVWIS
jgi:hypothetical protein